MAKSYYKSIGGKNFDRKLLAIAETATPRKKGKPLIELDLAQKLVRALLDGNEYTDVEKKTMKYIRDNYAFTKDADAYLRTEIRKFAARKARTTQKESVPKYLTTPEEPKPKRKKSKTIEKDSDTQEATTSHGFLQDDSNETLPEPEENQWDTLEREREEREQRELYYNQKHQNAEKNKKKKRIFLLILGIALVILFLLGIVWFFLSPKPKSESSKSSNLPTFSSSPFKEKKTNLPESPQEEESPSAPKPYDEFAKELPTAAPIRRLPVDKTNPKSSIRYINSLEVTFIRNQESLTEETKEALNELADVLKANPNFTIRIEGHTCWIGTKEENQKLSEARANLVRDYLVEHGVNPSQLQVRGYGELASKDTNRTKEGRQRNRRVEFSVLGIQGK